jgi:hypothetical protein
MPTGACGIDCDVCKLRLMEICSSCGPGKSPEARKKLEAQKRILGSPCPILACASMKKVDFCLRDCGEFPCVNFRSGPYPFSQGFLAMQERRRREPSPALTHNRSKLTIPPEYWERLAAMDTAEICAASQAMSEPRGGFVIPSFHEQIRVDVSRKRCSRLVNDQWIDLDDGLRELVTLLYLLNVQPMDRSPQDLIGVSDLKEAHYFKGPHAIDLRALLERYGYDAEGFRESAKFLKGEPLQMADAAFKLLPFPRAAVYFLLYEGDDEFQPRMTLLFERSIEQVFSASGIWSLVKVTAGKLLKGPEREEIG